ncbi:MAG: hypothetical protein LC123_00335 [Burkholderiales bacterium]|jgi:hypothetical protein|nr:hypothetical protein [Rhodocyclaceae bacterium]MCZ2115146.1 hypothetical protein [Anaerolineae bacterium]MCZ2418272.1 hypothetical protein [Burkholderiales bacterium]
MDDIVHIPVVETIVLVDYDNIRKDRPERSLADAEANLLEITEILSAECVKVAPTIQEVELRLYGGWITQQGQYSHRAQMLLSILASARKKFHGVMIRPELVFRLANTPHARFVGTLREDRNPPQQKMVDTLMAIDVLTLAESFTVFLATDDDDLVPAIAAAAIRSTQAAYLIRRRPDGIGLNDEVCRRMKVQFVCLPEGF